MEVDKTEEVSELERKYPIDNLCHSFVNRRAIDNSWNKKLTWAPIALFKRNKNVGMKAELAMRMMKR